MMSVAIPRVLWVVFRGLHFPVEITTDLWRPKPSPFRSCT